MNALELLLLRGGFTPHELGLPEDVLDPQAPAGIPCRGKIDGKYGTCASGWPRYARRKDYLYCAEETDTANVTLRRGTA